MTTENRPNGLPPRAIPVSLTEPMKGKPPDPIERLRDIPPMRPKLDPTPKGLVEYILVHKHPSWLKPVRNDKRTRTGAEYQERFTLFCAEIKANGVQQPVIAVAEGDAAVVVDGETRRLAALLGGLETIPILVYQRELSESELVIAQLQANAQRQDFTPLELAAIYAELMNLNNWSQAQLARAISVNPAQIAKCLAISSKLCQEVQEMVTAGDLSPRAAYTISRVSDLAMQIDLARKTKESVYSVEGLEAHVARLLGKKEKKSKPMKFTIGGLVVVAKGNVVESLKAFISRASDALRRLEKDNLPVEVLPSLLR